MAKTQQTAGRVEMGLGAVLKGSLSAAHVAVNEMLERPTGRLGITLGEADVLTVILISDDQTAAPTDLAFLLGLTTAGITGRLNSLEKQELIERRPHSADGRRVIVHLTDRGRELAQQVLDLKNDLLAEIVATELGADRAKTMIEDLHLLMDASRRLAATPDVRQGVPHGSA